MMRNLLLNFFVIAVLMPFSAFAQIEEQDSTEALLPLGHFEKILSDSYMPDSTRAQISVFTSSDCGRCKEATKFFKENNIGFTKYSINNPVYDDILKKLVRKAAGRKAPVKYPVIIVNQFVYYQIIGLNEFLYALADDLKRNNLGSY